MDPPHIPLEFPPCGPRSFGGSGPKICILIATNTSCHLPGEDRRQRRNKVPVFPALGFRWGGVGVLKGGLRELHPKAGIGETCRIGYRDQFLLSTPCTETGWWP